MIASSIPDQNEASTVAVGLHSLDKVDGGSAVGGFRYRHHEVAIEAVNGAKVGLAISVIAHFHWPTLLAIAQP